MAQNSWFEEGYEIFHESKNNELHIYVADKTGKTVGEVTFFEISTGELIAGNGREASEPFIKLKHRRKGLMTAMYNLAERVTGKKIAPTSHLSSLGEKFWDQKNRGFGN